MFKKLLSFRSSGKLVRESLRHRRPRFETLEGRKLMASLNGDFNGDGYDDFVTGTPSNDTVNIVFGSKAGLNVSRRQEIRQFDLPGQKSEWGPSAFGASIAVGDYNRDGFDDLAVSNPFQDVKGVRDAGAVHIVYGSRDGLVPETAKMFTHGAGLPFSDLKAGDHFGWSLATGDFDSDGYDDLAASSPYEDFSEVNAVDAGIVNVMYGSASGITYKRSQVFHQNMLKRSAIESGDHFGLVIVVGDFNGDKTDDLAIGSPFEDDGAIRDAGVVNVLYGRKGSGLSIHNNDVYFESYLGSTPMAYVGASGSQGYRNVTLRSEVNDQFGGTLAAGDFNGDGIDDLAVGVVGQRHGFFGMQTGAVDVIFGSRAGLDEYKSISLRQQMMPDTIAAVFGASLTAGDFNANGIDDLVIGAPHWSNAVGTVTVVRGSRTSLGLQPQTAKVYQRIDFGSVFSWKGDAFGTSLSTGDFNGDGKHDLVVSAPNSTAASIHIVMGSWRGIDPSNADAWYEYTITRKYRWPGSLNFGITLVGLPSNFVPTWVT